MKLLHIYIYTYNHLPLLSIHSASSARLFLSNTALCDLYTPTLSPVPGDPHKAGVSGGVTGPSSRCDLGSRLYGDRIPRPLPPTDVRYVPYPSSSSEDISSSRLACSRSRDMTSIHGFRAHEGREDLPSGNKVTAHPPPPAPVNFVLSLCGSLAVFALIASNDG